MSMFDSFDRLGLMEDENGGSAPPPPINPQTNRPYPPPSPTRFVGSLADFIDSSGQAAAEVPLSQEVGDSSFLEDLFEMRGWDEFTHGTWHGKGRARVRDELDSVRDLFGIAPDRELAQARSADAAAGTAAADEDAQSIAQLREQIGGQPVIRDDAAMEQRIGASLLQLQTRRGETMLDGATPEETLGDRMLVKNAQEIVAKAGQGGPGAPPPQAIEWARGYLSDYAKAQSTAITRAEQERAKAAVGPEDYMKRVHELKMRGLSDEAVASVMAGGKWATDKVDSAALTRLDDEVEILALEGQFERAASLKHAKVAMLKQGLGAVDVNLRPGDVLLDALARRRTEHADGFDAFGIGATNAFFTTVRGLHRLFGTLPPGSTDRDILERYTEAAREDHPFATGAGEFVGGVADPVFLALTLATGGVPVGQAAKAMFEAKLIAKGLAPLLAKREAAALTAEGLAREGLQNYFVRRVGMSAPVAKTAAGLVWNAASGSVAGAGATALQVAPEKMTPGEKALAIAGGAGEGAVMTFLFSGLHMGLGRGTEKIKTQIRKVIGRAHPDLPPRVSKAFENGVEYVEKGMGGPELQDDLARSVETLAKARKVMGRPLKESEIRATLDDIGVDLDTLANLKPESPEVLRASIAEIEARMGDPATPPEQRAALNKQWERAQRILAEAGEPETTRAPGMTADQAESAIRDELRAAIPDNEILDRVQALDRQARASGGLKGADLEEYKGLLGDVVSRDLTVDFKIRSARELQNLTGFQARKWEGARNAFARAAERKVRAKGPAKGIRGADRAGEAPPTMTREQTLAGFKSAFKHSDEESAAVGAILDARAEAAVKAKKVKSVEEYYGKTFAGVVEGGKPGEGALYQGERGGLVAKAREAYGTTRDPREAGYVTPEGEMLDFSGRRHPKSVAAGMEVGGSRQAEHGALGEIGLPAETSSIHRMLNEGAVRVDFPAGVVQMTHPLTDPQMRAIAKAFKDTPNPHGRYVEVIDADGTHVWSKNVEDTDFRGLVEALAEGSEKADAVLHQRQGEGAARIAASVEFQEDGRAVIRALERPDITSALHEIGHVFRRQLDGDDLRIAATWAGAEDGGGTWGRKAEERFARGFERYLRDGEAPLPALKRVFEQFKAWFTSIYQSIRSGPLSQKISPEMREVFDRLLGGAEQGPAEVAGKIGNKKISMAREPGEAPAPPGYIGGYKVEDPMSVPPTLRPAVAELSAEEAAKNGYRPIEGAMTAIPSIAQKQAQTLIDEGQDAIISKVGRVWKVFVRDGEALPAAVKKPAQNITDFITEPSSEPPIEGGATKLASPIEPKTPTGSENVAMQATGRQSPDTSRQAKGPRSSEQPPPPITPPVQGQPATLEIPGRTEPLNARYAVVSASDAIPSHDARAGFEPNAFGDINERDYRDPTEGKALRENIFRMRDRLNPAFLHTDSPTAIDGPPIMTEDLVALGGNARTMLQQLVYHEGGDKAAFLRDSVHEAAAKFGIDAAAIEGIKDPMIVRIVPREQSGKPGELSRVLNQTFTAAKTSDTDAVSRGRKLTDSAVSKISGLLKGDTTLADVFNEKGGSSDLMAAMIESGAMTRDDMIGLTDQRGLLNQEGRRVVERTLLGAAVPDVRRLAETPPQVRSTLIRGLPAILKLRKGAGAEGIHFDPILNSALDALKDYRDSGARSLTDLIEQSSMFPQPWRENRRGVALAAAMLEDSPTKLVGKLNRMAGISEDAASGQMMLGGPAKVEGYDDIFPYEGPEPGDASAISGALFDRAPDAGGGPKRSLPAGSSPYVDGTPRIEGVPVGAVAFRDALRPVPMPELLKLARAIGVDPTIKKLSKARGMFSARGFKGSESIHIAPDTATEPESLAKTLAHEIGHLIDYMDDRTMNRGNVLGRALSFKPILDNLGKLRGLLKDSFPVASARNKDLRKELIELTKWWKPYDPAMVPNEYRAYRESSPELYADALSVLLNSPGTLQERAPKFYNELLTWFDRKPEVFKAYNDLQDLLGGKGEDIIAARRADIREDFATGEQIMLARAAEARAADQSLIEWVGQMLQDSAAPMIRREHAAAKRGFNDAQHRAAQSAMEEYSLRDNAARITLGKIQREVYIPMLEAEVTREDAGEFLMMNRIAAGDRQAFGNPRGHTPETAAEQIKDLERKLGPEKWRALKASVDRYQDIVYPIYEEAVAEGIYNQKTFDEQIAPNRGKYATFAVLDHLEDYIPASIMKQVGTFKGIANPFDTTLMKTVSLHRAIELNKAKRIAIVEGIGTWYPGEVKLHRPAPGLKPPAPAAGNEHLVYMMNGRPAYLEVEQYVAKAFQRSDIGTLGRIGAMLSKATYPVFHPLYVAYNAGWQIKNIPRDLKRTYTGMVAVLPMGEKAPGLGKVLRAYWDVRGAAWKRATGKYDPLIEAMLEDRALDIPFSKYDPHDEGVGYEKLLKETGLSSTKDWVTKVGEIWKPAEVVLRGTKTISDFTETLPKAAAYKLLTELGIDSKRKAYIVRNYVGTPNTRRRGLATNLTNSLFMYSNVALQGLRADIELATSPKTAGGWWLRSIFVDFLPKMAMRAAALGAFGASAKLWMSRVPDYDKAAYIILPLGNKAGENGEDKAAYLRLPHGDTQRILAAVTWYLSEGKVGKAAAELFGQLPTTPNPWIEMVTKWAEYAQGRNPYDDFRNREIMSRDAHAAGGWAAAGEMFKWTASQFGVLSTVMHSVIGNPGEQQKLTTAERIIGSIPGIEAIVKFSDRGLSEAEWEAVDLEDQEKARFKLDLPGNAREMTKERYRLQRLRSTLEHNFKPADAARLQRVSAWYKDAYLPLTKQMQALKERGDTKGYGKAKAYLEALTDQASRR